MWHLDHEIKAWFERIDDRDAAADDKDDADNPRSGLSVVRNETAAAGYRTR